MYTLFAVLIRYESTKVLSYESTKVQYEGTFESTFVLSKYVVLSYVLRMYNYLRRYFRTFVLSYFRRLQRCTFVLSKYFRTLYNYFIISYESTFESTCTVRVALQYIKKYFRTKVQRINNIISIKQLIYLFTVHY